MRQRPLSGPSALSASHSANTYTYLHLSGESALLSPHPGLDDREQVGPRLQEGGLSARASFPP